MWVWLGFLGFFWVFFTTEKNFVGLRFLMMLTFFHMYSIKKVGTWARNLESEKSSMDV